jgi:RNA polymerase sigma-70 factor (ECF subfamily)
MSSNPVPAARLRLVPSGPASARPPEPSAPALDDSELLSALRRGDSAAATALHDRVRPQIDRTIFRLLGRGDVDHGDLAQLAMIELVYTIERYRGDCSLDSWTSTITAHVVYKHLRRRKLERRIFAGLDPEQTGMLRSRSFTGRQAAARSSMERIRGHLEAIEEAKAWTFVLHDVCGYDLRETAQITGVSVAAAQTRLVRGRREIHERIANDPELAHALESGEGEP